MLTLNTSHDLVCLNVNTSHINPLKITPTWSDNKNKSTYNNDIEFRCSLLSPNNKMFLIDSNNDGNFHYKPYIYYNNNDHSIDINPLISNNMKGKVALAFSLYSSMLNGPVAITSLDPIINIGYDGQKIVTKVDPVSKFNNVYVYTYIVCLLVIQYDKIYITPCGVSSQPHSDSSPWMTWNQDRLMPKITMDGPCITKHLNKTNIFQMFSSKKYQL